MAHKDVIEYYKQIQKDYIEMREELKDLEKECMEGLVSPEQLDQMKSTIEPLKTNYERISYIIYLMNKPVRKKKHSGYENRNQKFLKSLSPSNSIESTLNENNLVLKNLKTKF